jgi:valyl-tRNA synthetase
MALDKTYNPKDIEGKWYAHWENTGAFECGKRMDAEPYTIIMPPPNVTGSLHMGHALDNTLQDILIRFERLRGKDVLWQPGTDHAGIATQMVVERQLDEQGISRKEMGREKFLERVWEWKDESGGIITDQLRKLGASCDWSREAFTMDEARSAAVLKKFVQLYKEGLLYKAQRLVNWDPKLKTAISDLEVEQKEVDGHFWYFNYPIADENGMATDEMITIATTRPETMLGDSGIAVHPDDDRFKHLIGKNVLLPIVDRLIPIVGDDYADPEQGTGIVKMTPAHDFNDFEVGKRHNLAMINIFDEEAKIVNSPEEYLGLDRFEARKVIVADMEALGLVVKIESHRHPVPYGDRGGVAIEPWLTDQWYVDAETLAKPAIEAVETGKTNFIPKNWEKTYFEWMRNIQPWCVSRQLWWGHRIPAWYAPNGEVFVEETEELAQAAANKKLGGHVELTRDNDVLDTWFSSAMWPYSTLGWPGDEAMVDRYYPNSTLVTGFDIIFFWVARMMMSGLHFRGEVPFKNVYIHALVRDEKGAKMSKSKGNVIDPLDYIGKYGADALRFTLAAMEAQGRDIKMSESRVEGYRNFGTKLWNAYRFCEMNNCKPVEGFDPIMVKHPHAKWITCRAAQTLKKVTTALDKFRFNEAADAIYHFTWGMFCDNYVELTKKVFWGDNEAEIAETRATTAWVMDQILTMLHPFMPFITEEIWNEGSGRSADLILSPWPVMDADLLDEGRAKETGDLLAVIREINSWRPDRGVPAGHKIATIINSKNEEGLKNLERFSETIEFLAKADPISFNGSLSGTTQPNMLVEDYHIGCLFEGIQMTAEDIAREQKKLEKLMKEIGAVKGRLGNEQYLAKAPPQVIEKAKGDLADLEAQAAKLQESLDKQ